MRIIQRTIPAVFLRYAPLIAKANPALPDAAATLRDLWQSMQDPKTESVTSGGVLFTRDEDGDVEMWVVPHFMERAGG